MQREGRRPFFFFLLLYFEIRKEKMGLSKRFNKPLRCAVYRSWKWQTGGENKIVKFDGACKILELGIIIENMDVWNDDLNIVKYRSNCLARSWDILLLNSSDRCRADRWQNWPFKNGHEDIVCSVNKLLLLQYVFIHSRNCGNASVIHPPRNWLKKETWNRTLRRCIG